jgi:hypothetical protein
MDFTLASVGRANLRSAASHRLAVPRTRMSTIGDRAFPVAGATVWNSLPDEITSSPTIHIFRGRLKTYLFRYASPGAIVWFAATLFFYSISPCHCINENKLGQVKSLQCY